ncbi:hypothetical protein BsWGS_08518 [Bradybaena similaris]
MANDSDICTVANNFDTYIIYVTGFLTAITVFGCVLVIFIIWSTEKLHGNTNVFIASLAASDILISVFFTCNRATTVPHLESGILKSKIVNCIVLGGCSGSINLSMMHMGIFAMDRYIKITYPFFYIKHVTKRPIIVTLCCIWIMGLLNILVPVVFYRDEQFHTRCILLHQPIEFYWLGAGIYLCNLAIAFICYFSISIVAFKHKKAANNRRINTIETTGDIIQKSNLAAAMKSVQFFAVVFGVFLLCTFPPIITTGVAFYQLIPENVYLGLFFLLPIHSVLNFIIYGSMNNAFYKALKDKTSNIIMICRNM